MFNLKRNPWKLPTMHAIFHLIPFMVLFMIILDENALIEKLAVNRY